MTSRFLIHDTFATAPFTLPIQLEWIQPSRNPELKRSLAASDIGIDDFALAPAIEVARLLETHIVLPQVAVISTGSGPVSVQTPVRPDEVIDAEVRLLDCSSVAEFLARATLNEFYGISVRRWSAQPSASAEVVVLEGADALAEPEAGFGEDLVRAWFILTGRAAVTHLLLAPVGASESERNDISTSLQQAIAVAGERRRDLRAVLTAQSKLPRERVTAAILSQRYQLTREDVQSLIWLIRRGSAGTDVSPVEELPILW